jgi:hypothetical protein
MIGNMIHRAIISETIFSSLDIRQAQNVVQMGSSRPLPPLLPYAISVVSLQCIGHSSVTAYERTLPSVPLVKLELVRDLPVPEICTVKGKKLIGATVKSSQEPAYLAHWTVFCQFTNTTAILSDNPSAILSGRSFICGMKKVCLLSLFMTGHPAIPVALSDISSDISSDILRRNLLLFISFSLNMYQLAFISATLFTKQTE